IADGIAGARAPDRTERRCEGLAVLLALEARAGAEPDDQDALACSAVDVGDQQCLARFTADIAALHELCDAPADASIERVRGLREHALFVDADDRAVGALTRRGGSTDEKFHEPSSCRSGRCRFLARSEEHTSELQSRENL